MTKSDSPHKLDSQAQSRFEALFRRGTELLHEGEAAQAAHTLAQAHALNPSHIDTAVNLSGAYILANKFRQAVPILESLVEQEPGNPMLWTNLGAAYLGNPVLARDEDQLKAITAFERALAINPITPNVAYNLGLIYRDRQAIAEAIHWFRRALQANPNDHDARRLIQRLTDTPSP
jgi:tetratricopeptide (TPR) repeat protein